MRNLILSILLGSSIVFGVNASHNFTDLRIIPKATGSKPTGAEGQLFTDSTTHRLQFKNSTEWQNVVGQSTADTLVNKSIDATTNTITNISDTEIKVGAAITRSKTASGNNYRILANNSSGVMSENAAITANRAVVSDANGQLTQSATTDTEIGYVSGVTSGIQGQINALSSAGGIQNLGLSTAVSANALTVTLKQQDGTSTPGSGTGAVKIPFRATGTGGASNIRSVTSSLSVVISAGSSLGNLNNNSNTYYYVYAIDNAGTVELAVSGSKFADDGTLYSTTAEGGSGAADSKAVLYSTTARTNVPVRLIGRFKAQEATNGTWATAPTDVSAVPLEQNQPTNNFIMLYGGNSLGGTSSGEQFTRNFTTTFQNTGTAVTYTPRAGTTGDKFTINEDGIYSIEYMDRDSTISVGYCLTVNAENLAIACTSLNPLHILSQATIAVASREISMPWTGPLFAGDVVRAQAEATSTAASTNSVKFVITKIR